MAKAKLILRIISTVSLLTLGGCSLLAPTNPYRPIPRRYRSESHSTAKRKESANVLQEMDSLGLAEAIEIALDFNPEVSAGNYDAEAAQAAQKKLLEEINTAYGLALQL